MYVMLNIMRSRLGENVQRIQPRDVLRGMGQVQQLQGKEVVMPNPSVNSSVLSNEGLRGPDPVLCST